MTEPKEPSTSRPERIVINDAIWVVERQDYIDLEPAVEESLFDDPQRLERAWDLTFSSLKREAGESEVAPCEQASPTENCPSQESDEFVSRYRRLQKEVTRKPETHDVNRVRFGTHFAHVMSRLIKRA